MPDPSAAPGRAPLSIRLHIPAGEAYRAIAAALAGKFAELAGCDPQDAEGFGDAIVRAAAEVAAGGATGVDFEFTRRDGRIEGTVSSAGRAVRVAQPLPT